MSKQFIIAILLLFIVMSGVLASEDERYEQARIAWNEFLSKKCQPGDTEQSIRQLMSGKSRDVAWVRDKNETHRLLFLVDDFHQIEFYFDRTNRLIVWPRIEPKCRWLRLQSGEVLKIVSPAETKMKLAAEQVAIRYVADHTENAAETLSAYCIRSPKASTWDVVVILNSLEVDTPNYLLEVSDDGSVLETRASGSRLGR